MSKLNYTELFSEIFSKEGDIAPYFRNFRNYSTRNKMFLIGQGAMSPVASFKKWQELGRSVKKGAKAKKVYAPRINTKDDESQETETKSTYTYFVQVPVFELNDTEGPELVEHEFSFDKDMLLSKLGIEMIPFTMINGNAQGYAYSCQNQIAINPMASYPNKTLLHEVAHCLLHGDDVEFSHGSELPRSIKELEAESVAYIVGCTLNILSEQEQIYSRGYIRGWFKGADSVPNENCQRIIKAVDTVLDAIDYRTKDLAFEVANKEEQLIKVKLECYWNNTQKPFTKYGSLGQINKSSSFHFANEKMILGQHEKFTVTSYSIM